MGRCQEFGPQIRDGCGHAMRPGENACFCPECGVTCRGLYAGCPDVWKRGPRTVNTAVMIVDSPRVHLGLSAGANGTARDDAGSPGSVGEPDAEPALEPNRPDSGDVAEPPPAVSPGSVIPEQPDTWGLAPAAPSDGEGPAQETPEDSGLARARAALQSGAGRARVPLTSDWDPASFIEEPPRHGRGRSRDEQPRDIQAAVPVAMDDSDPRTHVLKWMEKRFDGIRAEVQLLASGANLQQETLELLLDRQAEMEARLEQEAERAAEPGPEPGPQPGSQPVLDDRAADLLRAASDELGTLVDEVVTALQESRSATASAVAAQNENTERLRLLQAAVTRQLRTMTASVGELEKRSEARVAAYTRRVEALAKRLPDGPPSASATGKATGAVKATAGCTPRATKTAKPAPAPATRTAPGGVGAPPRRGGRAGGVPARGEGKVAAKGRPRH